MKLINPSDDELNAAFAEKVAGWFIHPDCGRLCPPNLPPAFNLGALPGVPAFTRSFDAVLPWLEKDGAWAMDWCPIISNRDAAYKVWIRKKGVEALGPSLPRAAVLALLRARGVEVEFTK